MATANGLPPELRFDGEVVVITGAGRGMGKEHALLMARRGARVVVSDLGVDLYGHGSDASHADQVVALIRERGGEAVACNEDLTDPEGARRTVRTAISAYGRIDALVHNAGFTLGSRPFGEELDSRLDKLLSINTKAAFTLAREAWPHMEKQGFGRLVLVASTALYGLPGSLPYSTAKASYIGMTRGLAAEGEKVGIKVNLVSPAGATRMADNMAEGELKTWIMETATVELVSPLVALLCHDACPVNGELFVSAGGRIARTVIGETEGWIDRDMTMESALAAMPAIMAQDPVAFPRSTSDSLKVFMDAMGFELSTPLTPGAGVVQAGGEEADG